MSDSTIKKINYGFAAIYFVIIVGFIIFQESPILLSDDSMAWKPIIEASFIMSFGLMFLILSIINSIAVWTRTADEYMKLLYSMAIGNWGKRTLRICSNRYWLWQARIILILFFFFGLVFSYVGLLGLQKLVL